MSKLVACKQCSLPYVEHVYRFGEKVCVYCHIAECIADDKLAIGDLVTELWYLRICAYCGMPAQDREHVVPKSLRVGSWIVPACKECNNLAGAEPFETFADKRDFIRDRLGQRYARILKAPEWDRSETAELGPGLRPFIRQGELMRRLVRARMDWCVEGFDAEAARIARDRNAEDGG